MKEWLQPREQDPVEVALQGIYSVCRTSAVWGEAVVLQEVTSKGTEGTLRGRGPSIYTRIAEITPGRSNFQQGLTPTCKDPLTKRELKDVGGFWTGP